MAITKETVKDVLIGAALRCRGPGGAIAVVKDGEVIGQHVWGLADLDQRIPMTAETQMPICSITKQFVCALLIDLERNPTPTLAAKGDVRKQLTDHLNELLNPELTRGGELTIERLCDMQSGLRDYWAMTTLWGSKPDDEFLIARDSGPMLAQTKSFQFQPGTEYSYCNLNYHILARVIERATGESLDKLLGKRILRPAGMSTAFLCPNTANHPPPCVGYEGDEQHGFTPAVNRIEWSGDAGLVASLTDMIAYEKDGTPARYRYGLSHTDINKVHTIGHGGALRGYRLERLHSPNDRLSVVVMLNSDADAYGPTINILRDLLELPRPELIPRVVDMSWYGVFLDPDTQLSITVLPTNGAIDGELDIKYDDSAARFKLDGGTWGEAETGSMNGSIDGSSLTINRWEDNRTLNARRIHSKDSALEDKSFLGVYEGVEIESTFHCIGGDGILYGAFDGYLGKGNATPMKHLGEDVWGLTCPRGLDAPAPGDWTMVFSRDESDEIQGFTIGCWLARKIEFVKKA
ncbi:Peptidase S12 aminopeptidase DmpB domain C [Penicillium cf. griseofulvum]|nr:Peptidase S12 aminopeptidase DmpB domain C [Penicillium cf. griseofulvum]